MPEDIADHDTLGWWSYTLAKEEFQLWEPEIQDVERLASRVTHRWDSVWGIVLAEVEIWVLAGMSAAGMAGCGSG